MPHAYTEDQLVAARHRVVRRAWLDHGVGVGGNLRLDRCFAARDEGRFVLVCRLRLALERFNPALPPEAITATVDELARPVGDEFGYSEPGRLRSAVGQGVDSQLRPRVLG
jgi:hypothetical protein